MRRILLLAALLQGAASLSAQPAGVKKLMAAYPDFVTGFDGRNIVFKDGTKMLYDDGNTAKTFARRMDAPDVEDQFYYTYPKGAAPKTIAADNDPGRIRNEPFFKKMYGSSAAAVKQHLTIIKWCPKLVGQQVQITTVNGVDKALKAVSAELDEHPELKPYITNIGGTFNWRLIAGTSRISMHSFGMTVDINTRFSNYWQWDCKCSNEAAKIPYVNRIPQLIVDIFERHGFIWGGKWYHHDTMHFEYRPELL